MQNQTQKVGKNGGSLGSEDMVKSRLRTIVMRMPSWPHCHRTFNYVFVCLFVLIAEQWQLQLPIFPASSALAIQNNFILFRKNSDLCRETNFFKVDF